jgi:hypothetical protein
MAYRKGAGVIESFKRKIRRKMPAKSAENALASRTVAKNVQ